MMEPYAGNNQQFVGSDHLPIVADYVVTFIPGDFNGNGVVDAADYVAWRKGLGTLYTQNDYNVWRAHFGQMPAAAQVPLRVPPFPNQQPC